MGQRFGAFLRGLREQRGLTLRQVEEQVQISNAYLSQIERGERGVPRVRILKKLASAYGVSVTELIDAAEKEIEGEAVSPNSSEPDAAFVSRGYQNLSKENRQHLSEFLQFLLQKEKKRIRETDA